jgi:hypothetical protein
MRSEDSSYNTFLHQLLNNKDDIKFKSKSNASSSLPIPMLESDRNNLVLIFLQLLIAVFP